MSSLNRTIARHIARQNMFNMGMTNVAKRRELPEERTVEDYYKYKRHNRLRINNSLLSHMWQIFCQDYLPPQEKKKRFKEKVKKQKIPHSWRR